MAPRFLAPISEVVVDNGRELHLLCSAAGNPTPVYRWVLFKYASRILFIFARILNIWCYGSVACCFSAGSASPAVNCTRWWARHVWWLRTTCYTCDTCNLLILARGFVWPEINTGNSGSTRPFPYRSRWLSTFNLSFWWVSFCIGNSGVVGWIGVKFYFCLVLWWVIRWSFCLEIDFDFYTDSCLF